MSIFLKSIHNTLHNRIIEKPSVMIVGMHRSGTGLLTDILQRFGVFMGKNLSGNRESLFFQGINKDLLDIIGCNWRHLDGMPAADDLLRQHSWMLQYVKKRIGSGLIGGHFEFSIFSVIGRVPNIWGWKDPRNSLLIPLWKEIFPKLTVVHIYRDGRDVALSLLNREIKRNKDKNAYPDSRLRECFLSYFDLWESYVCRIRSALSSSEKSISISYENLLKNPEKEIQNLAEFLNVILPNTIEHICSVVDVNRRYKKKHEHFRWINNVRLPDRVLCELGYDSSA